MKPPVFVQALSPEERWALTDGLRSPDAVVLRRCQMVLASARGERAPRIAQHLGCSHWTVLNAIAAFSTRGLAALVSCLPASVEAGSGVSPIGPRCPKPADEPGRRR